jgi:hypothetical protein
MSQNVEFDYSKLIGRIVEKYGTRRRFGKALGVSNTTLYERLSNRTPFTQPEILKSAELLSIPHGKITQYFFTPKVRKIEQGGLKSGRVKKHANDSYSERGF